jgi:hypothetical protein
MENCLEITKTDEKINVKNGGSNNIDLNELPYKEIAFMHWCEEKQRKAGVQHCSRTEG